MDSIILSLVRTQAEVGVYGATYRVLDILTMLPAVLWGLHCRCFLNILLIKNTINLRSFYKKFFDALIIFAVPIVVGTQIISRPIMEFFAGKEF